MRISGPNLRPQTDRHFAVQSEVAAAIAERSRPNSLRREQAAVTAKPTENPEAMTLTFVG